MKNTITIIEEDKFLNKKAFKLKEKWEIYKKDDTKVEFSFSYNENSENISILIRYEANNWIFMRDGVLSIKSGSNMITLTPLTGDTAVFTEKNVVDNSKKVKINEIATYLIPLADFRTLLNSDRLEMRLSGSKGSVDANLKEIVSLYMKAFYHENFDKNCFSSEHTQVLVYVNEMTKANLVGVGTGCVIPFILFIMVAYGAFGDYHKNGWIMSSPFIVGVVGFILYIVLNLKANKKAFNKQVD